MGVAPAESDVRMVIGGFGNVANFIYKGKRFGKIGKFVFSLEHAFGRFPSVKRRKPRCNFVFT